MLTKTRFIPVNLNKKFKGTWISWKVLQMFNMRTACDTAHVKSVLRLLLNMLQHVLGNSLQCGSVSLLTTCLTRELNWRLLPKTCCSMFRRSYNTDTSCAALQAVRILNIWKTFHGIHVPLNFYSNLQE